MIHLKGGKDTDKEGSQKKELSEEFLKAIQDEYATRYLEHMNINPTKTRKQLLLQQKPLTSCYIDKMRNSSGWLADQILIYPNRLKKKCSFESERDQKLKEKFQKI